MKNHSRSVKWTRFLTLILLGALCFFPDGAFAKKPKAFDPMVERVAFAFYKLGGKTPDFKVWVENKPEYLDVRLSDREAYVRNEMLALKQRFATFDPERDLISVRIVADITVEEVLDSAYDSGTGRRFELKVSAGNEDMLYFPYELNGQYIAMIPNNLDQVLSREIDEKLFRKVQADIGYEKSTKSASAVLNFLVRPTSVDMTQPMPLDGKNQWLMMAEIATFSVTTAEEGEVIWDYRAPWYYTETEKNIGGLYRE